MKHTCFPHSSTFGSVDHQLQQHKQESVHEYERCATTCFLKVVGTTLFKNLLGVIVVMRVHINLLPLQSLKSTGAQVPLRECV